MSGYRRLIEYALLLAVLIGLFCLLFGVTFQAQFALIDDHEILHFTSSAVSVGGIAVSAEIQVGRFRPVYYLFRLGEIALFGATPPVWHVVTTGFGVLTCFLFYVTMREIGADILSSLLFILLFTVTGYQNSIWYRLGPAETLGMLLTSISVWAIANAARRARPGLWDGVALVAMALAGLTKESFALIIPALLLLRWTLQCWFNRETWQQAWRTLRAPLVGGALIFIAEILVFVAVLLSRPEGYGAEAAGLSLSSFDPRRWYDFLTSPRLGVVAYYLPFLCALIVLVIYWRKGKLTRPFMILAGLLVFIAWVIPQLVLYSNSKFEGHYLFPAIVGVAAVNALGLAVLWQKRIWVLWVACVIWLVPSLFNGLIATTQAASLYTARTLAVREMVTYLAENVEAEQAIVIAANPAYSYEAIFSLGTLLGFAGSDSPVYLFPILPEEGYPEERFQRLAEKVIAQHPDLNTLDPLAIGGIIKLDPVDYSKVPAWFISWRETTFDEPYYAFSIQELRYVEAGNVSYRILTPD